MPPPPLQGAAQSVAALQLASYRGREREREGEREREREREMYNVSPSHMHTEHTVHGWQDS